MAPNRPKYRHKKLKKRKYTQKDSKKAQRSIVYSKKMAYFVVQIT